MHQDEQFSEMQAKDELPPFESFASISRLNRACVITEKLDGTNAQIRILDDGLVIAGSRNRWITPADDNFGFAKWAKEHEEELRSLGAGSHYGEWWGSGIQRRYGLKEKRFSLFNTGRWANNPDFPSCCSLVPVLYQGQFSTNAVDAAMQSLRETGSVAAPGFMDPEGIVVFLAASRSLFKVTLDGDGHKSEKVNKTLSTAC